MYETKKYHKFAKFSANLCFIGDWSHYCQTDSEKSKYNKDTRYDVVSHVPKHKSPRSPSSYVCMQEFLLCARQNVPAAYALRTSDIIWDGMLPRPSA
jgi:hypothetical protein